MNAHQTREPSPHAGAFDLRDREFEKFRKHLYEHAGIKLDDSKRDMVSARLTRRLRHHHFSTFEQYLSFLESDASGKEWQEFINSLTTNKTDFFRESHHFEFLRDNILPRLKDQQRPVRIWSAGCSTGEEPYTLAMCLREAFPASQNWDLRILASDIDTQVLSTAEQGIYEENRLGDIAPELLKKYFLRGTGANAERMAVRPEIRDLIRFRQINLMADQWPIQARFDAIFCRNVVIYFDNPTKRRLIERFAQFLNPDGFLFLGHSENVQSLTNRFALVGKTIYRPLALTETLPPVKQLRPVATPPKETAAAESGAERPMEHNLILGDVKAVRGPATLTTLLGSCVSACIFDPDTGVGGMNHFSLPGVSDEGTNTRYGAYAMEMLITAIMKAGGDRYRLRAKVFGGAKVLNLQGARLQVGAQNVEFVRNFLDTEQIPIDGQCLGGTQGLIVRFNPQNGQARVKTLPNREMNAVIQNEQRFGEKLQQQVNKPADDGIRLF